MKYSEKTCEEFIEILASNAPVPGGGGASALVGSIGMALGNMVGSLTIGKKKYADVEADIIKLKKKADVLQQKFLVLIDKDAEMFEPLAKAYKLPKETEEEKAERSRIMEEALKDACTVPLVIMKTCCEAIELHKEFALIGTLIAISDIGCGVSCCRSALQSASLNIFVNTKLIANRDCAEEINQKANTMLDKYIKMADDIFTDVRGHFE